MVKPGMARRAAKPPSRTSKQPQRAIMVKVDEELRNELQALSAMRGRTLQQLGVEAICDLLRKYGRPVNMADAFAKSAREESGPPVTERTAKRSNRAGRRTVKSRKSRARR